MNSLTYKIDYFLSSFSIFPLIIQIAIIFIVFAMLSTIVFISSTFIIDYKRNKKDEKTHQIKPLIDSFLKNVILTKNMYSPEEISEEFKYEFGNLKDSLYGFLVKSLSELKHSIEDVNKYNYKNVIYGLKIDEYLEKKLDSANTKEKLKALHSLSQLEIKVSDSKILPNAYSKNDPLRKESRVSYVGLSNSDPFKFFDQISNLNQWNQITLLKQFEKHHKNNLPSFSKWIKYSKNNDQIKFFIKMIEYFKQYESSDSLIELINSDNEEVRKDAIHALGKLKYEPAEEHLIEIYKFQHQDCQKAIIYAIHCIDSGKSLPFLISVYIKENNYEIKKIIAEAILKYNNEGANFIKEQLANTIGFEKKILQHITNPLIQSTLDQYSSKNTSLNEPNFFNKVG